jgi:hypothetical protein
VVEQIEKAYEIAQKYSARNIIDEILKNYVSDKKINKILEITCCYGDLDSAQKLLESERFETILKSDMKEKQIIFLAS